MTLTIVIPAHNEQAVLLPAITKLYRFLKEALGNVDWKIVVVNNGSRDQTLSLAQQLAKQYPEVRVVDLPTAGKGLAIKTGWQKYPADIVAFMDADLATDLPHLPDLLAALQNGADIAIASRRLPGAQVQRSVFRRFLSWVMSGLAKLMTGTKLTDLPCGFKAGRWVVIEKLLPRVNNDQFFFDSELVLRAIQLGYKVTEVPVAWREKPFANRPSQLPVLKVVNEYLANLWRLR